MNDDFIYTRICNMYREGYMEHASVKRMNETDFSMLEMRQTIIQILHMLYGVHRFSHSIRSAFAVPFTSLKKKK